VNETITNITNVSLSVIVYEENPILLDTVYNIDTKKIGYFVYNFFARDSEDLGIEYERELNNLFGKFQTENIDELIIDLRYNSGGTIITALALASMISGKTKDDIFGYSEYNNVFGYFLGREDKISNFLDYINKYKYNGNIPEIIERVPINKLSNLNRVYMIVSKQTASASELLINGLRPYMGDENVVLIGETTYGKNVGSIPIYEEDDPENTWGMLPIVLKLSNSEHFSDYADGFEPDIRMHEKDKLFDMKPLGDIDELLLSTALDHIFGVTKRKRESIGMENERYKIIGSSIDRTPVRKNMYIDLSHRTTTKQRLR
jgi:C-terminal processing protease CtpA/Prc